MVTSVLAWLMPRLTLRLTLHHQICLSSKIIIRQRCTPSKVILYQRLSFLKGHLLSKVVFLQRLSSVICRLPRQRVSPVKGRLPSYVVFPIKCRPLSKVVFRHMSSSIKICLLEKTELSSQVQMRGLQIFSCQVGLGALDITVVQTVFLNQLAAVQRHALRMAYERKMAKHRDSCKEVGMVFLLLPMDILGAWSDTMVAEVK